MAPPTEGKTMHTRRSVRSKKRQMQYKVELICAYVGFWTLMTLGATCLVAMGWAMTWIIFAL